MPRMNVGALVRALTLLVAIVLVSDLIVYLVVGDDLYPYVATPIALLWGVIVALAAGPRIWGN